MARLGAKLVIASRNQEKLRLAIDELTALGAEALAVPTNVREPEQVEKMVARTVERFGRIDVLVNNAGVNICGPLMEVPHSELRSVLETNVLGLLAVTQAVFPHMADRRSGRIVNLGSVVGILPTPFSGMYCASKSAVHMLSEVLRMELLPFGIDVVVVQPGGVKSEIAATASQGIERYSQDSSRYKPMYSGIVKRSNSSQDNPMPTEEFARELVAQALALEAPRLIRLGTGADTLPKLAELPGPERDALMSAVYDLGKLTP
jgi:NAD(P)-dependent dehydrogenase (short-subunit alcohol dehydrogenase family)